MNILQKICFVLLLTTFSSVYGWDYFKDINVDNCRVKAAQGNAEAQYHLGVMYVKGQGVLQDYVMAHMYFNIESVNGDKDSVRSRDEVARKMTSSQIERVEDLVMEWVERAECLVMEWERTQCTLEYHEDRGGRTLIIIIVTILFLFFRDLKKRNLERDYQEQE